MIKEIIIVALLVVCCVSLPAPATQHEVVAAVVVHPALPGEVLQTAESGWRNGGGYPHGYMQGGGWRRGSGGYRGGYNGGGWKRGGGYHKSG
ncbi:unnamed protein product [Tenebrio molitor]|nr:unnamed protein product [Tenebrio molitor]